MSDKPTKTALVVSSSSSIDYLGQELPDFLHIIRQTIYLDGKPLKDVLDFDYDEFLQWQRDHPKYKHKTLGSSTNDVAELLVKLIQEGYTDVLFITQSRLLSTTNDNVREVTSFMANKLNIEVFDTGTFSASELPFILIAARLIKQGKSLYDIMDVLHIMHENADMYVLPNDIGHIIRQGRVGKIRGLIASWMDIKPLLRVRHGEVSMFDKARKSSSAMAYFSQYVNDKFQQGNCFGVGVYSGSSEFTESVKKYINPDFIKLIVHVTPGILAHFGVDSVGVTIFTDMDKYIPRNFEFKF